jgi:hypothetical protein
MFMTPKEITDKYQPLDGDRMEKNEHDYYEHVRGGMGDTSGTFRSHNTQGDPNYTRSGFSKPPRERDTTSPYKYNPGEETDKELWSRKLEESKMPKADYMHAMGGTEQVRDMEPGYTDAADHVAYRDGYPEHKTGGTNTYEEAQESFDNRVADEHQGRIDDYYSGADTLHSKIKSEGVKKAVHLSQQRGMQGKPQIVGGHHRIAASMDIDSDSLIPVIHHRDFKDARSKDKATDPYPYN